MPQSKEFQQQPDYWVLSRLLAIEEMMNKKLAEERLEPNRLLGEMYLEWKLCLQGKYG